MAQQPHDHGGDESSEHSHGGGLTQSELVDWYRQILDDDESPFAIRTESGGEWPLIEDSEQLGAAFDDDGSMPPTVVYRYDKVFVRADLDPEVIGFTSPRHVGCVGSDRHPVNVYEVGEDPFDRVRDVLERADRFEPETGQVEDPSADLEPDPVGLVHGYRFFSHVTWFSHVAWFPRGGPTIGALTHPELVPIDPGDLAASGVKVGVIDTGVDPQHSWLSNRVAGNLEAPPGTPLTLAGDHAHPGDPADLTAYGHGTGVCGVIRQGAPGTELWVRQPDFGNKAPIIEDLELIRLIDDLEKEDCTILNLSFGGEFVGKVTPLRFQLWWFRIKDPTNRHVVAAAGNREKSTQSLVPVAPAGWPEVIAVAGGPGGDRGSASSYYGWSNGGTWVDRLLEVQDRPVDGGTLQAIWTCYPGQRFAAWQGTSFLAPIVTAIVAGGVNPHDMNPQNMTPPPTEDRV